MLRADSPDSQTPASDSPRLQCPKRKSGDREYDGFIAYGPTRVVAEDSAATQSAKICSGISGATVTGAKGKYTIEGVDVSISEDKRATITQYGQLLGRVQNFDYRDYTKCISQLTPLIGRIIVQPPAEEKSGLRLSVGRIILKRNKVISQFKIENTTDYKLYIRVLIDGHSVDAMTSLGETIAYPQFSGIEICTHDTNNCLGQSGQNLDEYSSIDAGQSKVFSATYNVRDTPTEGDTIAMSIVFIARFAAVSDPLRASRPTKISFSLNDAKI